MRRRNTNRYITAVVLVLIASWFLCFNTHADVGPPYTYSFDVVVTNPDGAKTIKPRTVSVGSDGKQVISDEETVVIPVGTRLTIVSYYTDSNGVGKMSLGYQDEKCRGCTINSADVDYAEKDFDMSTLTKNPPISVYTITDDVYLYKGPHERYGKNDDNYHLPAGVVVTSVYYDGLWMYVEYEGHSGWIYHYTTFNNNSKVADVADDEWSRSFITTREKIELTDSPYDGGKVIATIDTKPLTELPVLYYIPLSKFNSKVYISYGQVSGWYYRKSASHDVASRGGQTEKAMTIKDTYLANFVDSESGDVAIPANTKAEILYTSGVTRDDTRYYIRSIVDGRTVEGWTDGNDLAENFFTTENGYREMKLEYEQDLFDVVGGKSGKKVEAGVYYALYYYRAITGEGDGAESESWYYISKQKTGTNGVEYETLGWIKTLTDDEIEKLYKEKEKQLEERMSNRDLGETETYVNFGDKKSDNPEMQILEVIIWFIVGFCLVVTPIVIVFVIIKKRQKNDGAIDNTPDNEISDKDTIARDGEVDDKNTTVYDGGDVDEDAGNNDVDDSIVKDDRSNEETIEKNVE